MIAARFNKLAMGALGCQLAVSLMLMTPHTDKGWKSTRIDDGKQRRGTRTAQFQKRQAGEESEAEKSRYESLFRTGGCYCVVR